MFLGDNMVSLETILEFISDNSDINIFYVDGMTYVGERMEGEELHYTQTRLIDAYILYKALNWEGRNIGFDYEANNEEVFELGEYIARKSGNKIDMETIEKISKKMSKIGCKDFLTIDRIRYIISKAVDEPACVGINKSLEEIIKIDIQKRKNEIPQILLNKNLNEFINILNLITEENGSEYITQNGKIYKYIGDV